MIRPILILGGGGHARVLIDALRLRAIEIIGIADADPARRGMLVSGVPVLGDDTVIEQYGKNETYLVNALGSVDIPRGRRDIFERFKKKGFTFATVVHPSAVIASDVELGEGAHVMAGAVIQSGSRIGINTIVNTHASVDHDCFIEDHVHLAPGVTLSGEVRVSNLVHVGTGAVVIQGITIGRESVIGAGAVVVSDIPHESRVAGVPARQKTFKIS